MVPKLPLELLRTLACFAETENITAAALKLGLTQPGVSLQLKRLEAQSPLPLFTTEGKRKVFTRYGRSLERAARRELQRMERTLEGVHRQFLSGEKLSLRVGARREIFHRITERLKFLGSIELQNLSNDRAIRRLAEHRIDLAISHTVPDLPGVVAKKLFTNGIMLVVHPRWLNGQPMDRALVSSPDFLLGVPSLAYRSSLPFLGPWVESCGLTPSDLKLRFICEDWGTILKFVSEGEGYSLIPEDIEGLSKTAVASFRIPESVVPSVTYYALFEKALRKVPAFADLLPA